MEGGQGEDTAIQANHTHRPESAGSVAAGDCHGDCAAMAVYGQRCERGAEVRTALVMTCDAVMEYAQLYLRTIADTAPPGSTASAPRNHLCE